MSRIDLHNLLVKTLGSKNVYYQPPSNIKMDYPAIVYTMNRIDTIHSNNSSYKFDISYTINVIDSNPDSEIVYKISRLPKCKHDRCYRTDNLNHNTFTIYH